MAKSPKLWSRQRCLRWLLCFRNRTADDLRLPAEINSFTWSMTGGAHGVRRPGSPAIEPTIEPTAIRNLQAQVTLGLWQIAQGESWDFKVTMIPSVTLGAVRGKSYYEGNLHDSFLLAFRDFLVSPGSRTIEKCRRCGCRNLFIRLRHAAYCGKKCARLVEAERARDRRARLSVQDRYEQRQQAYERQVKKRLPNAKIQKRGPRTRAAENNKE